MMMSGNLDYMGVGGGRGNSLKRTTLNSNGKCTTGVGLHGSSHGGHGIGSGNSSSNHENLMDQFIMTTPSGKLFIPQGNLIRLLFL